MCENNLKNTRADLHHVALLAFKVLHHLLLQLNQLLQLFLRHLKDGFRGFRLLHVFLQFHLDCWGGVAMH